MPSVRDRLKANKFKIYAWVIGLGFILMAVHNPNQPLLNVAFLPIVGFCLSALTMIVVLQERKAEITLGSRWVWIPLLVIVAGMGASGIPQLVSGEVTFRVAVTPLAFGAYLFGVYLVARLLKEDLFAPFAFAVVIQAISLVVFGLTNWGQRGGALVGPTNYNMASGLLIMGTLFSALRGQWWLSAIALVGLGFAGAEEALLAMCILGAVLVYRRDWSRRILAPVGVGVVGLIVVFVSGSGLYNSAVQKISDFSSLVGGGEVNYRLTRYPGQEVEYPRTFETTYNDGTFEVQYDYEWEERLDNIVNWRWTGYKYAAKHFSWFGNGYNITGFTFRTVHNVPFVIVDQVGPFAAIAWLFVSIYCLVKTRWKYAWVAIFSFVLVDHYIWTQVAPWWWVLVGVSTASVRGSDLIFRREEVR